MAYNRISQNQSARAVAASRSRNAAPENRFRIEGEYVNTPEIAERLGINVGAAASRLAKLKRATGPITWARLRGESS